MPSQHPQDVHKVWAAVKRDYFATVEARAGLRVDASDKRSIRLLNAWRMLHAVDHETAARLTAALREMTTAFEEADDRRHAPRPQQLDQFLGQHEREVAEEETGAVLTLGGPTLQRRINDQFSRLWA